MKRNLFIDIIVILCLILFSWKNALTISSIIIIVGILSILSLLAFEVTIKRKNFVNIIINNALAIIIVLLTLISSIYSIDTKMTLTQVLYLILATYFSILLAILYNETNFLGVFSNYILVSIFMSIIMWYIYPNSVFTIINGEIGGYQGVYIHKNILARNMLIGAVISNYYSENYNKKLYKYLSLICYIFIIISKSSTSIFVLMIYFILKIMIKNKRYRSVKFITIAYSLVITAIIFLNEYIINSKFAKIFTEITGKTVHFTGRISIWNNLLVGWRESPILGRGYGALWSNSSYLDYIRSKSGVMLPSSTGSHNGYFDILGGIGLVGIILVLIFIYRIYSKNEKNKNLILLIIPVILMINFFENYLLGMNTFWITLVYFSNRKD